LVHHPMLILAPIGGRAILYWLAGGGRHFLDRLGRLLVRVVVGGRDWGQLEHTRSDLGRASAPHGRNARLIAEAVMSHGLRVAL
jgi:hypothetical protein